LDLLGGTELNPGQSEIGIDRALRCEYLLPNFSVQTAKQSCELLLKVIAAYRGYGVAR
jgi:hypothetical protein